MGIKHNRQAPEDIWLERYRQHYSDRQWMILSGQLLLDEVMLNELNRLRSRAELLGDQLAYDIADYLYQQKTFEPSPYRYMYGTKN